MKENPPDDARDLSAAVYSLWLRFHQTMFDRLDLIDQACSGTTDRPLSKEQRFEARDAAHKLAGSLGTFGLWEGSRFASQMEEILEGETPLGPDDHSRLLELAQKLRKELERGPSPPEKD